MYGHYDSPFSVEKNGISIYVEKDENLWIYKRTLGTDQVEKGILGDLKHIIINPVVPFNTPKEITPNLLVEFEKSLLVAGETIKKIFLTFPIEIGVFISEKENSNLHLLDVFTLKIQKFTLYGSVSNGIICKHWKSEIYSISPSPNSLQEGIMELILRNTTSDWVSISKAVFSAYGMRLYYDADVFMKAHMDVLSKSMAVTSFQFRNTCGELKSYYLNDQNFHKKATEVYNQKFATVNLKFDMGLGF
jgi:uncharacterized protein